MVLWLSAVQQITVAAEPKREIGQRMREIDAVSECLQRFPEVFGHLSHAYKNFTDPKLLNSSVLNRLIGHDN